MNRVIKIISLLSYSLIMLSGFIIALLLLFWLVGGCFSFGTLEQLYSIIGLTGFIGDLLNRYNSIKYKVIFFLIMLVPIKEPLLTFPIEGFNYPSFYITLVIFLIFQLYLIFIKSYHFAISL